MPYHPEFISSVRKATEKLRTREQAGYTDASERWALKSSAREYGESFRAFLSGATLERYFTERRKRGDSNVTLDIASDGSPLLELAHDGALAVGLSDPRTDDEITQEEYKEAKVDVITGSLLQHKTWKAMDAWLSAHKKESFDVVFYRPLGGVSYIGEKTSEEGESLDRFDENVSLALLRRVYPRLSKKDGELFAILDAKEVIPPPLLASLHAWVDTLNLLPGIEARLDDGDNTYEHVAFWVRKKKDAPQTLPEFQLQSLP